MAGHKAKANYKTFPCAIARDELKSTPSAFYLQHTKKLPMNKVYLSALTHCSSVQSKVYYHSLKESWEEFLCVLYGIPLLILGLLFFFYVMLITVLLLFFLFVKSFF